MTVLPELQIDETPDSPGLSFRIPVSYSDGLSFAKSGAFENGTVDITFGAGLQPVRFNGLR